MKKTILSWITILGLATLLIFSGCSTTDLKDSVKQHKVSNNTKNAQNQPPTAAVGACTNKNINDPCQFQSKEGTLTGVCNDKPGVLACAPGQSQPKQNTTTKPVVVVPETKPQIQNTTKPIPKNTTTQVVAPTKPQPPATQNTSKDLNPNTSGYTIAQAISDRAQLNTLAFGGLGFLTGNLCTDSFLPPGKVADFFGFQYLRDTTQAGKGHSTDFVTNAANNVLYTLNAEQKAKMLTLAKIQAPLVSKFALDRYPLMTAFRRQLSGDIPSGTIGLSKSAVMDYSSNLYELDANISIQRAKLFAEIINSLTTEQKQYLDTMIKVGFGGWTALPDQLDKKTLTHDEDVLMMTYASEMFAWYAGDIEADTYFCPERQGDYFGGFYIKDAPAIGTAGYTIDESITGDKGEAFIASLDSTQKPIITSIVDTQRTAITGIVDARRTIATELRNARSGLTIDEAKVHTLARQYGALDGEISYYYATAFAEIGKTISSAQKQTLLKIRDLDQYTCDSNKIYLYSEKTDLPTIENTDYLFK